MKKFLLICLLFLVPTAFAGDTGSYYNSDRDGEGLQLTRNGDLLQFFFYSYKDWQGCPGITVPDGGLVSDDNCHMNRWFLSSGDMMRNSDTAEGWLYIGLGLDYPKGVTDPDDPFQVIIGEAHIVGRYIISRSKTGWKMVVIHFGELLDKEDSLYSTVFDFNTLLLEGTD